MRVKEEREKGGLKLSIQNTQDQTPGPISSWQIEGKKVAAVTYFISGAPKSLWMVTIDVKVKDICFLEGTQ